MAENHVLLSRQTLTASAASVTFSNIPQSGYTDLKIVVSSRTSGSGYGTDMTIAFNGSTSSFTSRRIYGYSSTAYSDTQTNVSGLVVGSTATANTFSSNEIYIPNYLSSNYKSYSIDAVSENNNATSYLVELSANLWSNTAAINSITIAPYVGTFDANSTFSLYGIAAVGTTPAIAPKARGGDITNDGTYWIHTFNSTDTFTPLGALSCNYLVVAGGGGGAYGGAGGAGGLLTNTLALSKDTSYTVSVGSGGAGGGNGTQTAGTDSSLSGSGITTVLSYGGGKGMYYVNGTPNGGSGGGTVDSTRGGSPGTGVSGQGYAGGQGASDLSTYTIGGGGGGAGAAGGNASNPNAGAGGVGIASSINGTSTYYAGGGGGGADGGKVAGSGGNGGGGAGASSGVGTAGTANRGGGGGGGQSTGGNGGSGIVIIRYAMA